jgi:hypothetical protein
MVQQQIVGALLRERGFEKEIKVLVKLRIMSVLGGKGLRKRLEF